VEYRVVGEITHMEAFAVGGAISELPHHPLCVRSDVHFAALEVRKVYQSIDDPSTASRRSAGIIDESGEDDLYPSDYFEAVELPQAAARVPVRA
jgi:hypothetical protein